MRLLLAFVAHKSQAEAEEISTLRQKLDQLQHAPAPVDHEARRRSLRGHSAVAPARSSCLCADTGCFVPALSLDST